MTNLSSQSLSESYYRAKGEPDIAEIQALADLIQRITGTADPMPGLARAIIEAGWVRK